MDALGNIVDQIRSSLEEKNTARDKALQRSRAAIRHCAKAIRAVHREERSQAQEELDQAQTILKELESELEPYPDLYHAGYTRDAFKEYAEARIVYALIGGEEVPEPEDLGVESSDYLGGLGEAVGELRRRVLDIIRNGHDQEAERLMEAMDEIYSLLVTIDFPDAITGRLRRTTDMVRGVTERTRGDLTTSFQQQELKSALRSVERKLDSP